MISNRSSRFIKTVILIQTLFFFIGGFFLIPALRAEEADFELSQVQRQKDQEELTSEAIRKSKEKQFRDRLAKIKYSEILQDPDNFELNYQYAQQQVSDNNLLGAAGTLERVLLLNPDLAQVRLFYAVVLFRLDNLHEAKSEIERLKTMEMPDSLRDELNLYVKEINKRQRRTHLGLRQSVGWQIDTNRNAAPSGKRQLFFEIPLGLQGVNTKQRDTSFINVTTVDVTHDLGFQAGHQLLGSLTYYRGEQTLIDSLDIASIQFELGGVFKSRFFDITPTYQQANIDLSSETFLRTQAMNLRLDKKLKKMDLFSESKIERQDYRSISENVRAYDKRGRYLSTEAGLRYKLTPNTQLLASIGYSNKNAKVETEAYERLALKAGHTWLLPRGHFILNGVDVNFDYYDEVDRTIAGRYRKDKTMRYKGTYGVPLGGIPLIGRTLPRMFKDVVITATYEWFRSSSSITNFTYTNHKFQTMVTKRWEI